MFLWPKISSILQSGFDVFNALDLMENKEFLEALKFGIGDGNLQYYLYNWRCPPIPPNNVWLTIYFMTLFVLTFVYEASF